MSDAKAPFLKRVRIENFRSIAHCDVALQPLTLLVGPNGSGKTNFLDAIWLVREFLQRPVAEAIAQLSVGSAQNGSSATPFRRRPITTSDKGNLLPFLDPGTGVTTSLRIALDFCLSAQRESSYSLAVEPPFKIKEETCVVRDTVSDKCLAEYSVIDGEVAACSFNHAPPPPSDRPYLPIVTAFDEFRVVYDALRAMLFYAVRPDSIRLESSWLTAPFMSREATELGAVLWRINQERPEVKERIGDYMRAVLPGLHTISIESRRESLNRLRDAVASIPDLSENLKEIEEDLRQPDAFRLSFLLGECDENMLRFGPSSMSDGTLRALGILVAMFQCRDLPPGSAIPLVAIEEPEANLHPGAAEVLMDAMTEASGFTQVLATTHSPDFLDYPDLDPESLLVFDAASGETIVDTADDVSKSAIRDKLYSAGELMRMQQLRPRSLQTPTSPARASE